jgi:DNA-binding NtrC family response regulator
MPIFLQPKLLRVLQEREFYRLGDVRPVVLDVRVIATTNRRLEALVEDGLFRQDLYYRLNVIPLALPPLRERDEDMIELAEYFAAQFAAPEPPPVLSSEFRAALLAHSWPGNVRELANTIRRAVALSARGELGLDAVQFLPSPSTAPAVQLLKPVLSLRDAERSLLEITLNATDGNRTHAAELLGVSLRTIRNKIREYGLPPRRFA